MNQDRKAYILLSLTMLFWAGNFVLARGIHTDVPPVALAWARWTGAFLIVLPFAFRAMRRDWPIIRQNLHILIFLGTLGVASFNTLSYIALNHTTAINALILQSSAPFSIVLASFVFFGDRITLSQGLGIGVSLLGVLAIICKGDLSSLASLTLGRGDLLLLLAVICWAVYTAFLRKKPDIHCLSFAAVTFFVGSAVNTPLVVLEYSFGRSMNVDLMTAAAIAYVAVFPSVLAYIFYNQSVEIIGPARTGAFIYLVPMFGAVLAITLIGETLFPYHLAGFGLILTGVWLSARRHRH